MGTPEAAFENTWKAQSGWVSALPPLASRVRIAILDTAARPFDAVDVDTDPHGRAVGVVAHELGCPNGGHSGDCVVEVVNHLALPIVSGETENFAQGGHFGTRGHLARALETTLDTWLADRLADPETPERLVVNLSLGWEPTYGSTMLGSLTAANDAVHTALERAVCAGAIVIAAAGNGGSYSDAAMFPAAWEAVSAPSPSRCAEFNLPTLEHPVHAPPGTYAPLVHAVGGVGPRDLPLIAMRSGGQPRLAAHALSVHVSDDRAGGTTYSGTSMAAATVSGIAAVTWALNPGSTGAEVMQAVYDGGANVSSSSVATEVCLGYSGCSSMAVKRAHLCGAVMVVDANYLPACQATAAFAGGWPSFTTPEVSTDVYAAPCPNATSCLPIHPGREVRPWVDPQPTPRCPVCSLDGVHLYAALILPDKTTTMVLTTYDAAGTRHREHIEPPPGGDYYPEEFEVSTEVPVDTERAALTITVDGDEPTETTFDIVAR